MQRDAAELLYSNAISGVLISLITSSFLVFAFSDSQIQTFKISWWMIMTSILTIRLIDVIRWRLKLSNTEYDGRRAIRKFIFGVNTTAIMWALYSVFMTTQDSNIELTTTIIAIAAMAGGSATVLAAHKFTAIFYAFILLFPASISLIISAEYALQILGILGLAFSFVMVIVSKKSADFTSHTILLKNENAVLVNRMEEQVEQRTHKIYELSNLDPLTGLYNRTAFLSHLRNALNIAKATNSPIALLFIDLDGFKNVNDSIGHKAGDRILLETAKRLKKSTLNTQLLCRWGGDEFLIALTDTNEERAKEESIKIIDILSQPHRFEHNCLSISATIGIALYPDQAISEDRLIQLADTAMYYQKKSSPSNACVFSEQMEKHLRHQLFLKNHLTDALEKKQLRLVYQPLVLSDSKKTFAFEALLRWNLDEQNIPPDAFIHIAEQYGLIHEIGAWVLINACKQAVKWDKDKQLSVCVNVSVIQLQDDSFIEIIDAALAESQLAPELLHIEITESVFASEPNMIANHIKKLQNRNIIVSIDDFGTGYSSLSVMQDLAVNVVKIDRSFVNRMNGNGHAIISAVMHIATLLNFKVVAEGVETQNQEQELTKLGVNFLQGFYFSKPIEQDKIDDYLKNESTKL
jgi:diguanylate cyclase (GGDEF)-like protein